MTNDQNNFYNKLRNQAKKSAKSLWNLTPVLLGTMLLISLLNALIPKSFYQQIFSGNIFLDPVIGSLIGGIAAGNPIISYLIGGELTRAGISLLAVTAFIVSWVTIGTVQLPAESMILGKKFAIWRNALSFVFSIITSVLTVTILILAGGL